MAIKKESKQSLSITTLIGLVVLLLTASCSYQESSKLRAGSIVYCSEGSPEIFNPQLTTDPISIDATAKQLYNTLITLPTNSGNITPALAKSWHLTEDGKLLTFYLRKGVGFHQTDYFNPTRFMNADDVLFSFNRILDNDHPFHSLSSGSYPFFKNIGFEQLIEKIEKIDDYTIRFQLAQADSSLLSNLASNFAVILSKEYAEQLLAQQAPQQLDVYPIGTGPFKLKNYQAGSYIRYQAHPNYWGESAQIEQLVFDITPSNTGRLTKLLTGECDVVNHPIAHEHINSHQELQLSSITAFNVNYLAINTQKPPLNNKLVRQALHKAINKKNIVETIFFNKAEPADDIIPANSWAYSEKSPKYIYSPERASEQLARTNNAEGLTLSLLIKADQYDYNPDLIGMAVMIQENLSSLNIQLDIVLEHDEQYNSLQLGESNYDLILASWSSEHGEPNNFFKPLLSCQAITKRTNKSLWCNQEYDSLINQAIATTNLTERQGYYQQALALIYEESPLIPISHAKQYLAQSKTVSGLLLTPYAGINFQSVRKN